MNRNGAAVCAAILVIVLNSEQCFSLENPKTKDNVNTILSDKSNSEADIPDSYETDFGKNRRYPVTFGNLFESIEDQEVALDDTDASLKRRVVRQAYQGQTQIYPNLPSGPPYGLEPYPNSNNNQNPTYNPQWQHSYNNNHSQSGYPSQINGFQPNYRPNNYTNNPSGPYGQNPQPNPWQPNGYQPNYNNPYGTSTQPAYPGYNPGNSTQNNFQQGPYGQNPQQWQPQNQLNNGQRPYNPSNGSYPSYNNNAHNPYPGYKPGNTYNNSSSRPPYHQPGQHQNNSYSGYPSHTPGYRPANTSSPYNPNQRPQYYPGQTQVNNTRYPQVVPGNQHPVIYDDSTKRPGQNPYGTYNVSNWSGNTLNNTQARPPYNSQNGQNPQYYNSYPGAPGYGSQNSTNPYNVPNQRPQFQDPHFGQYPSNTYPGGSSNSATFNLANNGYNPNIPNKPPSYSSGPYGNNSPNYYPNGTSHDPTRVSPTHFNSY